MRSKRRSLLQSLEPRRLLAADPFGQNPLQPLDVSRDGQVSPIDALQVINAIARASEVGMASPEDNVGTFIDVNGDGAGTPSDALSVINALGGQSAVLAVELQQDTGPPTADPRAPSRFDLRTSNSVFTVNVTAGDLGEQRIELRANSDAEQDWIDVTGRFDASSAVFDPQSMTEIFGQPLGDGDHRIELRLQGDDAVSFELTIDTIAPTIEQLALPREDDSGNLGDFQTVHSPIRLRGATEPETIVQLNAAAQKIRDLGGHFEFGTVSLSENDNLLILNAIDAAGNVGWVERTVRRLTPNQPPEIESLAPISVFPGSHFEVDVNASDPEGAALRYSLDAEGMLPPGELTPDGRLTLTPRPEDLGEYEFDIVVSDGEASARTYVSLQVIEDPITTTRLSGIVLNTESEPIPGIPVTIGAIETSTDESGRFTLDFGNQPFPDGKLVVHADQFVGSVSYPSVAERLDLVLPHGPFDDFDNQIGRPIYLPVLAVAGGASVDPDQVTLVEQPLSVPISVFGSTCTIAIPPPDNG
ncbi:MAG: dockerin type I domain-containing protein, partial [Planctomycetota bacterium]